MHRKKDEKQTMKNKKVTGIIIALIAIILIAAAVIIYLFIFKRHKKPTSDKKVFVVQVKDFNNSGLGMSSRFMGVVESQETTDVKKDSDKKVKETYVKVGDIVKKGDKLFSYDTEDMELALESKRLELQGMQNTISSNYTTVADLTKQRDEATSDEEKFSYTSQINSTAAQIREEEYELSVKQLEITRQEESIKQAVVYAPMSGVIKSINDGSGDNNSDSSDSSDSSFDGEPSDGSSGSTGEKYITIMAEGDFRVKGTADEQNVYSLTQGTPVLVHSRVSDEVWNGTISKVDMEPSGGGNNNDYFGSQGETSNYTFHVDLDSSEGLMLGQHLYIQLDDGMSEEIEGLFVPAYYVMAEDDGYYVWKQDEDGLITKAKIEIDQFVESREVYTIASGLTEDDYIAYPEDFVEEGMACTLKAEEAYQPEEEGDMEEYDDMDMATDTDMMEEYDIATDGDSSYDDMSMQEMEDNADMENAIMENAIMNEGSGDVEPESEETE